MIKIDRRTDIKVKHDAPSVDDSNARLRKVGAEVLSGLERPSTRQQVAAGAHLMRLKTQLAKAQQEEEQAARQLARAGSSVTWAAHRDAKAARLDIEAQISFFQSPSNPGQTVKDRIDAAKKQGQRARANARAPAPREPSIVTAARQADVRARMAADARQEASVMNRFANGPAPDWDFGHSGNHLKNP